MNWLTYSSGAMLGVAIGFALWQARRFNDPHDYISQKWLTELEQRERQEGVDGICWAWPVRKYDLIRGGRHA